jgi:hypothetical protein
LLGEREEAKAKGRSNKQQHTQQKEQNERKEEKRQREFFARLNG